MIGAIMSGLSWVGGLFGSSDSADRVLEKTASGIYNGLDKLWHTEEEKADGLLKARELFVEFAKITHDQNSIRSITRRWLAFMVMAPIMLIILLAVLFHGLGLFFFQNSEGTNAAIIYATFLFSVVKEIGPWGAGVLIFYFGPHLIGSWKK